MTDKRIAKLKRSDFSEGLTIDKYEDDEIYTEPTTKAVVVYTPMELLKAKKMPIETVKNGGSKNERR